MADTPDTDYDDDDRPPAEGTWHRWRQSYSVWRRERRRARTAKGRAGGRRLTISLFFVLILLLGTFFISLGYLFGAKATGQRLTLDEARALAEQGRIATATFQDEDNRVVGRFVALPPARTPVVRPRPAASGTPGAQPTPAAAASPRPATTAKATTTPRATASPRPSLKTYPQLPKTSPANNARLAGDYFFDYPASGPLTAELYRTLSGARIDIDKQVTKQRVRLATTFLLPLMILATAFALLFSLGRATSSAIGEVMTFGTIGRGKAKRSRQAVTFEDVGGAEEAVAELREVRDYLTDPDKYEALGAAPPKGVLLFGPPGCGKTLLAKAVAGEANVPFFSISGAEFVESLVGVGAARVRDLFQRVRAVAPAIVFIDELDAAARKRGGGGGGGGSDEREQTLNQLLVEMDGFEVSAGIVVIGATNRPDILDPAIMRPGRFDRHITIERPEHEGREHILRIHAKGKPIAPDVDFTYLADRTPGFTGADLANVVNEAALLTIRLEKELIEPPEFMEAIQRVLSGPKRRGRLLTDEERERTAYHEAGHVVVAAAAGHAEEVHRVSILARGRAVATTDMHSDADASLLTHSQLRGRLVAKLAGIATENLIYGEGSTGGEQDLEEATTLARDMVARYGFSPRLGPVRLLAKSSAGFLQEDTPLGDLAPETREAVDTEIRRLIAEAQAEATAILSRHRKTLDGLAARLQAEETLEGDVLQEVLKPISKEMSSEHIGPNGRTNGRTGTRTRNNGSGNVKVRSGRPRAAATRHR